MTHRYIILWFLVISMWISLTGVRLIIDKFKSLIDQISFLILPFGIGLLYSFHEDAWAVLVIEIILFKCEHFIIKFFGLVPSLQILLLIYNVLDIFVENIGCGSSLLDDLIDHVWVEVNLWSWILIKEFILDGEWTYLKRITHLTYFYIINLNVLLLRINYCFDYFATISEKNKIQNKWSIDN